MPSVRAAAPSLRRPLKARCSVTAGAPDGSAAWIMPRSISKKLNFSGKQKYSVSSRYAGCDRAGKPTSDSSSPKPAGASGTPGSALQTPLPGSSIQAAIVRMNSVSRKAALNDGSPSMNTRSCCTPCWATPPWPAPPARLAVLLMVMLIDADAPTGRRTASGWLMIGSKCAALIVSGKMLTGYTVRKVHGPPRTGRLWVMLWRGSTPTPLSCAVTVAWLKRAIEQEGKGRR